MQKYFTQSRDWRCRAHSLHHEYTYQPILLLTPHSLPVAKTHTFGHFGDLVELTLRYKALSRSLAWSKWSFIMCSLHDDYLNETHDLPRLRVERWNQGLDTVLNCKVEHGAFHLATDGGAASHFHFWKSNRPSESRSAQTQEIDWAYSSQNIWLLWVCGVRRARASWAWDWLWY